MPCEKTETEELQNKVVFSHAFVAFFTEMIEEHDERDEREAICDPVVSIAHTVQCDRASIYAAGRRHMYVNDILTSLSELAGRRLSFTCQNAWHGGLA